MTGTARPHVSLCMIVKNEAANLPTCLASAADLVDEVIVVDTGSTDATHDLAVRLEARVFEFAWVDDFAAARNESIRHATGDWIFWLDGDDVIDEANRQKLRDLFAALPDENIGYLMKCISQLDPATGATYVQDRTRLFRNRPDIRWQYRVHEQITSSILNSGGSVRGTDIAIHHTGYLDSAQRGRKTARNLRLLELEAHARPDDPLIQCLLGWAYVSSHRPADALGPLRRGLELAPVHFANAPKMYVLLAQAHQQVGHPQEALRACQRGLHLYPDHVELLFAAAALLESRGDPAGAEKCLRRLLDGAGRTDLASGTDVSLSTTGARMALARVCQAQGRSAEAETHWQAVLTAQPGHTEVWLYLADLYIAAGRSADLAQLIDRLQADPARALQAGVVQARAHLARNAFEPARRALEDVLVRFPREVWPRILLSHICLREGKDLDATERAVRAVLELTPSNPQAQANLRTVLRLKAQRSAPAVAGGPIVVGMGMPTPQAPARVKKPDS